MHATIHYEKIRQSNIEEHEKVFEKLKFGEVASDLSNNSLSKKTAQKKTLKKLEKIPKSFGKENQISHVENSSEINKDLERNILNVNEKFNNFSQQETISCEKMAEGIKLYQCNLCEMSYTQFHSLKSHSKNIHKVLKMKSHLQYKINSCDKNFTKFNNLKPIYCKLCKKTFLESRSLKLHIQDVHEGENSFKDVKCHFCKKEYCSEQSLKMHIKNVHEKRKDFQCKYCRKYFDQLGNLQTHIKTVHEGHKDYKCQFCSKAFTQLGNLQTHIKTIHEKRKDYQCNFCKKPYAQFGNLQYHIKINHLEETLV